MFSQGKVSSIDAPLLLDFIIGVPEVMFLLFTLWLVWNKLILVSSRLVSDFDFLLVVGKLEATSDSLR